MVNVQVQTGYVTDDDMKHAFTQADWVIVPYNSASQSGIIIDAYKYSRPVIAFDVGAISEQVSNGESGYLIPAGQRDVFVEKLRSAIHMPEDEYDKMTHNAYQYGCTKYAASGAVDRFLDIFSRIWEKEHDHN